MPKQIEPHAAAANWGSLLFRLRPRAAIA